MSDPTNVVVQNCEYYLRIVTIVNVCVKQALLDILHDQAYNGLPFNNQQQTHALLLAFKNSQTGLRLSQRNIVRADQWDTICHVCTNTFAPNCPRAGRTNTQEFDITIICVLISNYLVRFPPPVNGWRQPLAAGDYSKGACSIRSRDLRNRTIGHGSCHQIATQQEFDDCYNEVEQILIGLGYNNMQLFKDLKTSSLDPYVQDQIKFLSNEARTLKHELDVVKADKVKIETVQVSTRAEQNLIKQKQSAIETKQRETEVKQKQNEVKQTIIETKQNEMEAKQNEIESKQYELEADQWLMKAKHNEFVRKQNEMESNQYLMRLDMIISLIEDLKTKQDHLGKCYDRKYTETSSVAVDTNVDNLNLHERNFQSIVEAPNIAKDYEVSSVEPDDFIYDMSTEGCVLIINNVHFDHLITREGSDVDVERSRHFFCETLGWTNGFEYNERYAKDLTVEEMKNYIKQYSRNDFSRYGAFFLIICSHGNKYGVCGTDSRYNDSENVVNLENDILPLFTCSKVPTLAEKPKVFIIEASRGDMDDLGFPACRRNMIDSGFPVYDRRYSVITDDMRCSVITDAVETDAQMMKGQTRFKGMIPDISEYLICYPCVPGYTSLRNPRNGSYFTQALMNVFEEKYKSEDLVRMMLRVNYLVARATNTLRIKQLPSHDVRLSRLTYFHGYFLKMKKYMEQQGVI